jgi:hypothetical protein
MTSFTDRFLIEAAKLRILRNEKVGRTLTCMEEIGVGRRRSSPG